VVRQAHQPEANAGLPQIYLRTLREAATASTSVFICGSLCFCVPHAYRETLYSLKETFLANLRSQNYPKFF
jgi:hypothetical protein